MYELIQISTINDFIFCPYSIYFHSIYSNFSSDLYHEKPQTAGKIKHENIENQSYSTASRFLQGMSIYSEKYHLVGKIDLYDKQKQHLIERKNKIKKIYDGYRYQLYAQYFCMEERGYPVKRLFLHSLSDNKRYPIEKPRGKTLTEFENIINRMWTFKVKNQAVEISPQKCQNCIYRNLCDKPDVNFT